MKIFLLLMFLFAGCKSPDVQNLNPLEGYLNPQTKDDEAIREEYLLLVNTLRQGKGTRALIYSDYIENVAQEHSENMANGKISFGHTGSSVRCQKIITELGPANLCGEIVAQGQDNAKEVYASWTSSLSHRSKIENSRYSHTGLGLARNSKGVIFWTQIFLEVL